MTDRQRWPRRLYLVGGIAGIALVGIAFALNAGSATPARLVLAVLCAGVIGGWMFEGLVWHRRQAQRERERIAAEERAADVRREAQAAARRAARQVNARRTRSLGGTTINVHRRHAQHDPAAGEDRTAGEDDAPGQAGV